MKKSPSFRSGPRLLDPKFQIAESKPRLSNENRRTLPAAFMQLQTKKAHPLAARRKTTMLTLRLPPKK
jgi:hypothetical protein